MSKKLLFVVNPFAGGKNKKDLPPALEKFCLDNDFSSVTYCTTGKDADRERIAAYIRDERPDAVIVAGGDGTVNLVGEVIVGTPMPLGIIPLGSGNGLARDLGIPVKKTEDALEVIRKFIPHPIDTLRLDGRNCFHVSDIGFNARIVRKFSKSIIRGKLSYLWYGMQEFFALRDFEYIIETEKERLHGKAFMMAVINGKRFGTNANINPTGEIDDGFFEISIIKPFSRWKSFRILYHLFNNDIHTSEYNQVVHCKKAIIYNCNNTSFHIDGEPATPGRKIEVEIVPGGLTILMPEK